MLRINAISQVLGRVFTKFSSSEKKKSMRKEGGKNPADNSLVPQFSIFNVESRYELVLRGSKCVMNSGHFPPCFAKHLHHK